MLRYGCLGPPRSPNNTRNQPHEDQQLVARQPTSASGRRRPYSTNAVRRPRTSLVWRLGVHRNRGKVTHFLGKVANARTCSSAEPRVSEELSEKEWSSPWDRSPQRSRPGQTRLASGVRAGSTDTRRRHGTRTRPGSRSATPARVSLPPHSPSVCWVSCATRSGSCVGSAGNLFTPISACTKGAAVTAFGWLLVGRG